MPSAGEQNRRPKQGIHANMRSQVLLHLQVSSLFAVDAHTWARHLGMGDIEECHYEDQMDYLLRLQIGVHDASKDVVRAQLDAQAKVRFEDNDMPRPSNDPFVAVTKIQAIARRRLAEAKSGKRKTAASTISKVGRGRTTRKRLAEFMEENRDRSRRGTRVHLNLYISPPSSPGKRGVMQPWALRTHPLVSTGGQQQQQQQQQQPYSRTEWGVQLDASRQAQLNVNVMTLHTVHTAQSQAPRLPPGRPMSATGGMYAGRWISSSPSQASGTAARRRTPQPTRSPSRAPSSSAPPARSFPELLLSLSPDTYRQPLQRNLGTLIPQKAKQRLPTQAHHDRIRSTLLRSPPMACSPSSRMYRAFSAEALRVVPPKTHEVMVPSPSCIARGTPRSSSGLGSSSCTSSSSVSTLNAGHLHAAASMPEPQGLFAARQSSHLVHVFPEAVLHEMASDLLEGVDGFGGNGSGDGRQRHEQVECVQGSLRRSLTDTTRTHRRALMGPTAPLVGLKHPYGHPAIGMRAT